MTTWRNTLNSVEAGKKPFTAQRISLLLTMLLTLLGKHSNSSSSTREVHKKGGAGGISRGWGGCSGGQEAHRGGGTRRHIGGQDAHPQSFWDLMPKGYLKPYFRTNKHKRCKHKRCVKAAKTLSRTVHCCHNYYINYYINGEVRRYQSYLTREHATEPPW